MFVFSVNIFPFVFRGSFKWWRWDRRKQSGVFRKITRKGNKRLCWYAIQCFGPYSGTIWYYIFSGQLNVNARGYGRDWWFIEIVKIAKFLFNLSWWFMQWSLCSFKNAGSLPWNRPSLYNHSRHASRELHVLKISLTSIIGIGL